MSAFLDGIGTLIGVVAQWFSPKQRTTALKDELDKLTEEQNDLKKQKATVKNVKRCDTIDKRIADIKRMLANKATE